MINIFVLFCAHLYNKGKVSLILKICDHYTFDWWRSLYTKEVKRNPFDRDVELLTSSSESSFKFMGRVIIYNRSLYEIRLVTEKQNRGGSCKTRTILYFTVSYIKVERVVIFGANSYKNIDTN